MIMIKTTITAVIRQGQTAEAIPLVQITGIIHLVLALVPDLTVARGRAPTITLAVMTIIMAEASRLTNSRAAMAEGYALQTIIAALFLLQEQRRDCLASISCHPICFHLTRCLG
jgi:hypothetical protein